MTKLTSKEKFNTSFGLTFIIENPPSLNVGEQIHIDGQDYRIKELIFPTRPGEKNVISVIAESFSAYGQNPLAKEIIDMSEADNQ